MNLLKWKLLLRGKLKKQGSLFQISIKKELSEIGTLIKQFGEMKIIPAEVVTKVSTLEQLEQSSNRFSIYCKNCKSSDHNTQNCLQPCKICQGNLGTHSILSIVDFFITWLNYGNRPIMPPPTLLLEDEDPDFLSLKDLLAHEELLSEQEKELELKILRT